MEKNTDMNKNNGTLNLVLIILLVVVMGVGAFFAVRYFVADSDLAKVRDELATCNSITKDCIEQNEDKDDDGSGTEDNGDEWPEAKYLNIEEWGIRFKIPMTFTGGLSYKIDGHKLSIHTDWTDSNMSECGAVAELSKNNNSIFSITTKFVGKIDGNSYYVMYPQAACGGENFAATFATYGEAGRVMFESIERIK